MNGIDTYKSISTSTAKPEDLSKQVITSILSYINEAQRSLADFTHYKECLLNGQMLCVGAIFSLSGNERTKANIILTNVFDSVQAEILNELKDGTGDLERAKRLLGLLIEPPQLLG